MSGSFAFRRFGVSAAAVLALTLSACGGGGGGGSAAELAAAPASAGGAAPADGNSAAAGAPPGAGEGAGSPPVEPGAGEPAPGGPVGEGPGEGGPAAPGGGSAASPSAAAWHVFGEVGTGGNGAAPVTAEDLSNISVRSLRGAAYNRNLTSFASDGSGVGRQGLPNISRSSAWHMRSTILIEADEFDSYGDDWWAMGSQDRDSMMVRVGHNAAGQVSYSLNYREQLNPKSPADAYEWTLDSEAAGANVRRLGSGGRQGALLRREDSAGNLWAAVATDISGRGDTDWLATGVWAYRPADGAENPNRDFVYWNKSTSHPGWSEYRFGVFADGGDPFRASDLAELTGTATYEGGASGVYGRARTEHPAPEDPPVERYPEWRVDFFTADATLTVDFSAKPGADGEGAATGRIHNMRIGGRPIIEAIAGDVVPYGSGAMVLAGANPEITLSGGIVSGVGSYTTVEPGDRDEDLYRYLESATMKVRSSPSYDSSVFWDETWQGNWEGAFFGNPAPGAAGADRLPGSVAGAFGVARGTTLPEYIVGAFAAHRTGWTDAPEGVR